MKKLMFFLLFFTFYNQLAAQLFFKRDDFTGTLERRWWRWHNDPSSQPSIAQTEVHDGYVSFTLNDAIINPLPPNYCDAALWDGFPIVGGPYENVHVKTRVRASTSMQDGSIGWGLWYTEGNFSVSQLLWFMQSQDLSGGSGENWWIADKVNGNPVNRETVDLESEVNNQVWHTYEIDRQSTYVDMIVDGVSVLYTTSNLPTQDMAFHVWVDNIIYEFSGAGVSTTQRSWNGTNEILLDYIQIVPEGIDIDKSETPAGIKRLRQAPNDIYSGTQTLWKNYTFNAPAAGNYVFLITGRAEYYVGEAQADIDDDMRFVIDGTDYLWNSSNSFNPESEGTITKTMMFEQAVSAGNSDVEVHAETSPLLYDVTVVGSATGSVLYDNEYYTTKSVMSPELWYEIPFSTDGGEVAIYISGTANEDLFPSLPGNSSSYYEDTADDDMKIVLDGFDYGYQTDESFYGNELFGDPKSVLITENLAAGDHTLQILGQGSPTLYRVVIYGNAPDVPLPVTLSSFKGHVLPEANHLEWISESEINNFGFNLYRAQSKMQDEVGDLEFIKINDQLIAGAGNSSGQNVYTFTDKNIRDKTYYWYKLEDIDYAGIRTEHDLVSLYRGDHLPGKFILYNNYPNPFNNTTKITFYLAEETPVYVSFFDSRGQLVHKLRPEIYGQGLNNISWSSNALTSGIYYCSVTALQRTQTIKMLHIK